MTYIDFIHVAAIIRGGNVCQFKSLSKLNFVHDTEFSPVKRVEPLYAAGMSRLVTIQL